ncbi:hypothetical protein [Kribbella deserti]|uniref:Uncharacterized protein n=1 Tax=Kribbella deserti TaxID=1926257 RepID=A0ABV6QNB2_9ACTN
MATTLREDLEALVERWRSKNVRAYNFSKSAYHTGRTAARTTDIGDLSALLAAHPVEPRQPYDWQIARDVLDSPKDEGPGWQEMTPAQSAALAAKRIREALADPDHLGPLLDEALTLLRCFEAVQS